MLARPSRPMVLGLALLVAFAATALADAQEDMSVARSRMNTSAEKVRRSNARLTRDEKAQRRDLLAAATGLHDESKALSPGDDASAARLVQEMDAARAELDDFLSSAGQGASAPAASESAGPSAEAAAETMQAEPAEPAAPAEPPPPPAPNVAIAQYRDIARQTVDLRARMVADEYAEVRELIRRGDDLAEQIENRPHEKHVTRREVADQLIALTDELRALQATALENRRVGIPLVESRSAAAGYTQLGLEQGPFEVLRARFIRPGSAYITVRNASDAARPMAVSLDFSDVSGSPTGNAAYVTPGDADLRPGEVREVLLGIAPSIDRFWDLTTDFSVAVR